MKKILVLFIMVLGISANIFACFGNSMIESIIADQIIRSKELEDITKKEMKLIKKYGLEYCYEINIENNKHLNEKNDSLENNKDLDKKKDGLKSDKHLDEQEKTKNSK